LIESGPERIPFGKVRRLPAGAGAKADFGQDRFVSNRLVNAPQIIRRRPMARLMAFFLAAPVAFSQASHAQNDVERERTLRRTTTVGQEVRVFTYTEHRSDCSQGPQPSVKVLTPPAHGQVAIRYASVVQGRSRFGAVDCSGLTLMGQAIWYLPDAAFTGTDSFDYEVGQGNGVAHDTAKVEVKP
jgi:hypothetical protein